MIHIYFYVKYLSSVHLLTFSPALIARKVAGVPEMMTSNQSILLATLRNIMQDILALEKHEKLNRMNITTKTKEIILQEILFSYSYKISRIG